MSQVVKTKTILDECPAEVQAYFETRYKQLGAEAQVSKMEAKRATLAKTAKKKRDSLRARNNDISTKLREGEAISEETAQEYKGTHDQIRGLTAKINEVYRKKEVSRREIRVFKDASDLYGSDCTNLAIGITGLQPEATPRLDPAILARIAEIRKAKSKK